MGRFKTSDGRPEVLTDLARIEHAERGREALEAVQEALDEDSLLTDYTWRRIGILAQVAQAHFAAASSPNAPRFLTRSNTPDPAAEQVGFLVPEDTQDDQR